MRFLVDECLSSTMTLLLTKAGHDAVHVIEAGLAGMPDDRVLSSARDDERILLSADTDFGEILARSNDRVPSVILFRRSDRSARSLSAALLANLELIAEDLGTGALVVITDDRLRIRGLPLR